MAGTTNLRSAQLLVRRRSLQSAPLGHARRRRARRYFVPVVLLMVALGAVGLLPTHARRFIGGHATTLGLPVEPAVIYPGKYLVMTVRMRPLTLAEFLLGRRDDRASSPTPGSMDAAKDASVVAALRAVGRPVLVAGVLSASPAELAGLQTDDVITAVDNEVASAETIARALRARGSVRLRLLRNGRPLDITMSTGTIEGGFGGIVIGTARHAPVRPPLETGSASGSSAGLLLALADVDLMTPGSLTGGKTVAATGELLANGVVISVSGYAQKAQAAHAAGADIFLVPKINEDEVKRIAPPGLRVVGVATLTQAVSVLCALGGQSSACGPAKRTSHYFFFAATAG